MDAIRFAGTRRAGRPRRCAPIPMCCRRRRHCARRWRTPPRSAAAIFPSVQGEFDASRNRNAVGVLAPNLASGTALYNLFTPQVTVSYVPDMFGANRRQVESLAAQAEASRFQLDATYLTLTANVVTAAIQEAGLRAQIAATEQVIALERESLAVLRRELELGAIAEVDVFAQEAALAQLEATLPPLQRQLQPDARSVGRPHRAFAGAIHAGAVSSSINWCCRRICRSGVPSQLVERRPDVRAAEAQLHAATAQVGVAIANILPQFTITGNIGSAATAMSDLFKPGTRILEHRRQCDADPVRGRHAASTASAQPMPRSIRPARVPIGGADGISKRRRRAACARHRRGRAQGGEPRRRGRAEEPRTWRGSSSSSVP